MIRQQLWLAVNGLLSFHVDDSAISFTRNFFSFSLISFNATAKEIMHRYQTLVAVSFYDFLVLLFGGRKKLKNSFVIIISTSSLMPHDCLETFSHFILLFRRSPSRSRVVLWALKIKFFFLRFPLRPGNEFFFNHACEGKAFDGLGAWRRLNSKLMIAEG